MTGPVAELVGDRLRCQPWREAERSGAERPGWHFDRFGCWWSIDRSDGKPRPRSTSPHKHIRLTQLRDDLFRRKTLTSHNFLQFFRHNRLSLELDQFFQGRPNHADMDIIGTVKASCRERVCQYV